MNPGASIHTSFNGFCGTMNLTICVAISTGFIRIDLASFNGRLVAKSP